MEPVTETDVRRIVREELAEPDWPAVIAAVRADPVLAALPNTTSKQED